MAAELQVKMVATVLFHILEQQQSEAEEEKADTMEFVLEDLAEEGMAMLLLEVLAHQDKVIMEEMVGHQDQLAAAAEAEAQAPQEPMQAALEEAEEVVYLIH